MVVALFFLLAFLSEIAGTVAGFGSSVFFVPLASFFFDFREVLALTSVLHVFSNAAKLVLFGRHVQWRLLLLLGIPSAICVIVGAYLSARLEFKFIELVLGLFLIWFSVFFLLRPRARISPNPVNAVAAGGIAGFLAGLIGTGGAIRGLALGALDLQKNVFVATSAAIDSGVDFSRMIVYLRSGYLSPELYWFVPPLLLVAFAGSYAGKLLLNRIEQRNFRRIVLILVLLIGLTTLGGFIRTYITSQL
ncbi:MAG TPA: sulfite exporter TauE/SafE family protein [Chthoniobacterales bacterium]|nr:sulfite exporter TauE/SafE family protein [Chthoniobacterales bacterium]